MRFFLSLLLAITLSFLAWPAKTAADEALTPFNQAEKLFEKADYTQALVLYQQALALKPDFGEAMRGIGLTLEKMKQYPKAIAYLEKASLLLKNDLWIYCQLARNYAFVKNIAKVLENYDRAIALFKSQNQKVPVWIFINSAIHCYTDLDPKDPWRAIQYAREIMEGDYEDSAKKGAYESMAFAYFELKDFKNALVYAKLRGKDFWMTKQLAPRKIVFNCVINFRELMETTFRYLKPGLLKIHMPMDTPYQNFLSLDSRPRHLKMMKEGRENLAVFDFTEGYPEKLTLKITLRNITVNAAPKELLPATDTDGEIAKFADPKFIKSLAGIQFDTDNPILIKAVNEITGKDQTHKQKVLSLVKWIKENITHDMHIPKYANNPVPFKNISEVFLAKHGYCTQISALFIGMCRMIGIPARMIQGWHLTPDPKITKGNIGAHDTVEIYDIQNKRWIYVEPQGYSDLGVNYWAHVVFYAQNLTPRDNFIDVMMLGSKSRMTYEVFQE